METGFRYLTAERVQMNRWTRKRRLKFRKRWRRQHNGESFRWFVSEPRYTLIDCSTQREDAAYQVILFKRDTKEVVDAMAEMNQKQSQVFSHR